ncbi:MAG: YjbQ family protein [Deltaproteobacteria bacterium]|nr:YjbQ family protein [Deltaproteobacteria bacterium]
MLKEIPIRTTQRMEFIDITPLVRKAIREGGVKEGVCHIYIPHTTAAVTINEGADPDVVKDIVRQLDRLVPLDGNYSHQEGNAAAHIKASILGSSKAVLIEEGELVIGTWQAIFFCEFDGPRTRKVLLKVV